MIRDDARNDARDDGRDCGAAAMCGGARRRIGLGLAVGLIFATATGLGLTVARAENPRDAAHDSTAAGPASGAAQPGATPARAPTVRIVFKVFPPNRATVHWGKKNLGLIKPKAPLIIQRPRDSGPLDVLVRADGCVPVHTRAYTFTDSTVAVHITPLDKKNTIYGYREVAPDADGGAPTSPGNPDGGAPP